MASDKKCDEDLVEDFLLADDHLPYLGQNAVAHRLKASDAIQQYLRIKTELGESAHRLMRPLSGILNLQQQFLRGSKARGRLE
jgi:hypothetical protein